MIKHIKAFFIAWTAYLSLGIMFCLLPLLIKHIAEPNNGAWYAWLLIAAIMATGIIWSAVLLRKAIKISKDKK